MEQEKVQKKPNIVKRNLTLIAAFFVPILILLIIYITREIYPFGDQMYLRSDMYHQYAPFLKLFQSILKNGDSLAYTWKIGLGSNFLSTYAYYLASPLNWLVAILPSDHIPEIMSCFIMVKSGLMSAAMTYYLRSHFLRSGKLANRNRFSAGIGQASGDADLNTAAPKPYRNTALLQEWIAVCFGVFYAMSGYMAAYSWNVMWLDCLILLPLMMLGLERLVKHGKFLLYTVCFALAVLSNYYIAIMLCIWSVLYFIYLLVAESKCKSTLRTIGRFLLYSLIGGCIGAVIFLPALLTLLGTASADSSFPQTLKAYFNLLEMFAHGMMNTKVTMMDGYVPNIYCGIAAFALVPLFWLNRGIPVKQRAGKTILMAIMMFSFAFNVPAFIWHGFHFPNSLPSRQSFLYIFLILVIGYEALLRIRKVSVRAVLICFGVALAAVFTLQVLYDSEDLPIAIAYASAGFLIVYGVLALLMHNRKKVVRTAAVVVLVIICVAEMIINTDATGYGTTSRTYYVEDNEAIEAALSSIPDDDFYRVEKLKRRTKNDGAWSGYRSASVFSSVTTAALSDYYESFGMQSGTNSFSYYGNTPLSSAMLGVRYVLTDDLRDDPLLELVDSEPIESSDSDSASGSSGTIYLYQNKYCLPLGFMVNETTQAEVNLMGDNPFEVQNDFVDAAKGAAPVFSCEAPLTGWEVDYEASSDGRLYFFVSRKMKDLTITYLNGDVPGSSKTFTSLECPMIIDAGDVKEGDIMRISTSDEEVPEFSVTPATLDLDALNAAVSALGEDPLVVESFDDSYVRGTVDVSKAGMLFTSIPYDKGWSVFVDGVKTETLGFYDSFIQVPLSEGKHTVEFRYQVPGFVAGLIISLLALAALVVLSLLKRKKNMKKPLAK